MVRESAAGKLSLLRQVANRGADDIRLVHLPQKIFHPYRILIMKILLLHSEADFQDLKRELTLSDGNLASHLRTLEGAGFVNYRKQLNGRKVRTTYYLTRKGALAFQQVIEQLKGVLNNVA